MLTAPHDLFARALNMGYAIGAFNTSNLEVTQAIIWAAQKSRAPVIVQTSEGAIEYGGLHQLSQIIVSLAKESSVPVVLHLDHGKSLEIIKDCIEVGYTSVMIDASRLPLLENIAITKEVVDYAHSRQVWVEAELGAMLGAEGQKELRGGPVPVEVLTKPAEVGRFVEETGVDALAVSVGTIHGAFTGQEFIRFELVAQLVQAVPEVPFVLHGASGISDEHLARVVETNVCKVNVDTELRIAFEAAVRAYFDTEHDKLDPRKILGPAREAVQVVVEKKNKVFGASGKAD